MITINERHREKNLRKISRLVCTLFCFAVLSFIAFVQSSSSPAMALGDIILDLNFAPSAVEAGVATYSIGYVSLVSSTGEPVLAPSNLEVGLRSGDASIAFVPSRVTVPAGSDYARFEIEVSDSAGQTEISALYGNQVVTRTFKVVDALNLVKDVELVINLASDKMQIASEMPFSVYLENNGTIVRAPKDITVNFDYDSSLVKLSSDSVVINKGDYYGTNTIKTIETSGNAFIKGTSETDFAGHISTVANVAISQTQPVSLRVQVFPDKVGLNENNIDIFVGVLDADGKPTLAAQDIELDLFSSAYQLTGIGNVPAVIKKGEFGFYMRQYMNFYSSQTVTIGASASGLGASTSSFEVLEGSLLISDPKALDKAITVLTIGDMPSEADSIVIYQLNAIEHDDDDVDCDQDGILEAEDIANTDCDEDGLFDENRDWDKNGIIEFKDWHPIDDLSEGELYPVESESIFSQSQGNLDIVSGDNLAASVTDPSYIASGSSYGTAKIASGRQAINVDISVSLANIAVGSNTMTIVGGLNPTQTKIFSPAGLASDGNYRVLFDRDGYSDLYFVTLDSSGRPSNSQQGVKYLIKPVNELTEIKPETSFASLSVKTDSFKTGGVVADNAVTDISAVPVGVNADSNLGKTSSMNLFFHTGTTAKVLLPFNSVVAFSKAHQIGIVQLTDVSGSPVLASDAVSVRLSSSSLSTVLPASVATIPKGKSFTSFDVATFGRADNFTIYATADGLQASSAILAPVLAELPASFVGSSAFVTSVPTKITVSTPIAGVSVMWGASSGLQLLGNTTTLASAGDSYTASTQVMSDNTGTYTVDATLLKDGFKPTRISREVVVGLYQRQMNAVLVDNGAKMLAYNQPVLMQVLVLDASGMPVPGATVQVEDSGPQGLMLVSTTTTDASGAASFVYMPTNIDDSSLLTLMVTAYKDGYQTSRDSKVFEIDRSAAILPPIPLFGSVFAGLPSWTSYAILGGVAAVGSGVYMLKKQKPPEDEESLVVADAGAMEEATEVTEETVEDTIEDGEEEEEET
jgi:hypothetical protein